MTPNERFEIVAQVFHRRTGFLAPGKDSSPAVMASEDAEAARRESWDDFNLAYREVMGQTIEACDRWFKGLPNDL